MEIFQENDFYDHLPTKFEGKVMTNKEAGVEPSKKLMTIFPSNVKPLEYEILRMTLGDSVSKARKNMIELSRAIEEVKLINSGHAHAKRMKKLDQRFYK